MTSAGANDRSTAADLPPADNAESKNNGDRYLKPFNKFIFFVGAFVVLVLIGTTVLTVNELAARISATALLQKRLANVNIALSDFNGSNTEVSTDAQLAVSNSSRTSLLIRKAQYNDLLETIENLEISGANVYQNTIYAIQSRLELPDKLRALEDVINTQIIQSSERTELVRTNRSRVSEVQRLVQSFVDAIADVPTVEAMRDDESPVPAITLDNDFGQNGNTKIELAGWLIPALVRLDQLRPRLNAYVGYPANLDRLLAAFFGELGSGDSGVFNPEHLTRALDKVAMDENAVRASLASYGRLLNERLVEFRTQLKISEERSIETENALAGFRKKREEIRILTPPNEQWVSPSLYFAYSRSELLVALSVVLCGAIGAGIGGLRLYIVKSAERDGLFARIALGLGAGFIAYLVLKGGKFLFLVQVVDGALPLNPYTAAFAGILAGMFTETVFNVLSDLVNDFAKRVTNKK